MMDRSGDGSYHDSGIPRPRYIDAIRPFIGSRLIKVITGQRRVGKSYVLAQVAAMIRMTYPDKALVYVDRERLEWRHVRTGDDLIDIASSALRDSGQATLFVDEIQEINGFAEAIRGLAADGRWDIYLSGSNADLLSGEIATLFAGRSVSIQVHPLSYDEFLTFYGFLDDDISLRRYLERGGLPFLHLLPVEGPAAGEYLRGVYDSVLLKDIIMRHGIRNPSLLERIVEFIADNVGSPTSARSISRYLRSQGIEGAPQSVLEYLAYVARSYAIVPCLVADTVGKRILEGITKYYFEDIGLRAFVRGSGPTETGKIVENAVFCRLRIDGWDVSTGRVGDAEIDFVCDRGNDRRYVQAAYLVPDGETRAREFGSLLHAEGAWPRYVISMDPLPMDYQGIRHLSLRDFLRDGLPD